MKRSGMTSFKITKYIIFIVAILFFNSCLVKKNPTLLIGTSNAKVSEETRTCLECHTEEMPGIVNQWEDGSHGKEGIGCFECHGAEPTDVDAMEHNGFTIAIIVSPADCGVCHELEASQFLSSHHSKAGEVLGSLDNYLGEIVEGGPASISGCQACHGSYVEVEENGELSAATWPNFGVGRVNPDGTSGSCASCHSRHSMKKSQARDPDTCGKCHLGPDHPQIEIYRSSKHGMMYLNNKDDMNMDSDQWIPGEDYNAAPTCATCHLSETKNLPVTHDIGSRLSVNIRAPISFPTENAEEKRDSMKDVCLSCHGTDFVDNFYKQYDAGIDLYNNKFAIPATEVMNELKADGLVDPIQFNEEIEWAYWHLWHHEGRRARNGYAMLSPDYVQWHGMYEVAERFYFELLPEAEHYKPGIMDEIMSRPEHRWFSGDLDESTREEVKRIETQKYK
ncbi:MAG: multiheme c-type cytochrome [Spirochaetaceae bacterium]